MAALPSTRAMLLAYDSQRPRTQQVEIGMSALGGCRRQVGYKLAGTAPDPEWEPENIQAILGTAIHVAAAAGAGILVPEADAENLEVMFGGLKGHPDLYCDGVVRDVKTKGYGSIQLEMVRQKGPSKGELYQVHCYAAGLIIRGFPVHTVELDYIARDSGDEYIHREPFSMGIVTEAMAWLKDVREAPVTMLERDYRPGSGRCRSCEFFTRCWEAPRGTDDRTVLFRDDPDAAEWARKLEDARAREKAAKADAEDAKGALDELRTVQRPGDAELIEVPGLGGRVIKISVQRGRESPDMAAIAMDYKRAGARPPMRRGDPVIAITVVKPPKPRGKRA